MHRFLAVGALIVVGATSLLAPANADPAARIDRIQEDCTQIPPDQMPPFPADASKVLRLEARVIVDPADRELAEEKMATAVEAFRRIGIKLKVSYDEAVPPDTLGENSSDAYFDFMKGRYGGVRPRGVDVVYFITRTWSGGMADCIGGVRSAGTAFAFGSIEYSIEGTVPAPTVDEGVIAAHEIGHLLGAHHHYSNCAEALPTGALYGETAPCTTMSPLATTASPTFSRLEAAFIRYYTERYAKG